MLESTLNPFVVVEVIQIGYNVNNRQHGAKVWSVAARNLRDLKGQAGEACKTSADCAMRVAHNRTPLANENTSSMFV